MLDLWIVGIFLLITLIVGIWQGRGMSTFGIFSIAERKYSTAVLVATITATFLSGGSALGVPEKTFKYGMIFYFVVLGDVLKTFIQAKYIASNIDKFSDCISVGDIMGKSYGKYIKLFTGIAGTLTYITLLGAQISAIGYVFHYFLGTTHLNGILIGCGIIIVYSTFGGIKAVTITDVIQFIVLIVAIPIVCNVALSKVGGYSKLLNALPSSHFNVFLESKKDIIKNVEIFLILLLSVTGPATVQRLLMAQNSKQASQAFYYTALICLCFFTLVCLVGLSAKVLKPDLDPVLSMPYIIELLPSGLKGIAIAGLIAIIMSTADSALNTASILLVNDVISVLSRKKIGDLVQLKLAQLSTVLIGIFSIIAAFSFKSVLDIVLLSKLFWTPIIVIPFVVSVIGFSVERKSFWFGSIGAIVVAIMWHFLNLENITNITNILPAMIGNATFFFASHYYYKLFKPEKFDPIPNLATNEMIESKKKSQLSNFKWINYKKILLEAINKMKDFSIVDFSYTRVNKYGASYQLFAATTVLNYIWFSTTNYSNFLSVLKFLTGILCVGLFFAPELTKKNNKYFALYWHFTLMCTLPFISFTMVILNNGDFYWLLQMAISTFFLAVLVDWISFIIIMLVGFVLSCVTIKIYLGSLIFDPTGQGIVLSIYLVISSIIMGAFFSKGRENFIEEKLATLRALGGTIAHELRTPVAALGIRGQSLAEPINKLLETYKLAKEFGLKVPRLRDNELRLLENSPKETYNITNETMMIIEMLLTKLKDPTQETDKNTYSMKQIVEEAIERYPLYDSQKELIKLNLQDDFKFYGNKIMVSHVIFNLLKNAIHYVRQAKKGDITITIKSGKTFNRLYFKDTAKGIDPETIPRLFEKFYSKTEYGTGLGLSFCKLVMIELGGDISCKSTYGEYTEFLLNFPIQQFISENSNDTIN